MEGYKDEYRLCLEFAEKIEKEWVHYKIEFYSFALWSSDCNLTRLFLSKVVLSGRMEHLARQNKIKLIMNPFFLDI